MLFRVVLIHQREGVDRQMEWLTSIRKAIDYMEEHLEDNISAQDVAGQVFMSSFFFRRDSR